MPRLVRVVVAGMAGETSVPVMQTVLGLTGRLIARSADPAEVAAMQQALSAAGLALLRAAEPGSDWQLTWAQLLSTVASTREQLDLLAGLRDGAAEIPGLTVGTELRWDMLRRLASAGRATDADIDAELERDPTDKGLRCALSCRAAIPDAEHKAAAWRLLAESEELGPDGIVEVARGFGQPEHADLLAPYAAKYFAQLPAIWAARPDIIRIQVGRLLFPYTAASEDLLRRVEEFLAAADHDRGLARVVIEGRDVAEKALRARSLPA
jgi:aminopeptidase N